MGSNTYDHKNRSGSIISFLISAWIALLGAERIDFLNGDGPFILTPFLTISPLIIVIGLYWSLAKDTHRPWPFNIPDRTIPFVLAVLAFLILNLISIMFGLDPTLGTRRIVLLALILIYSSVILILMVRLENPVRILVHGAYAGLALYALFCGLEFICWLDGSFGHLPLINLVPATIGPFAPRVSGMSLDPNRGGMLVVVYGFLLIKFAPRSGLRTWSFLLAVVLLLLSLSKTALIAGAVMVIVLSLSTPGWTLKNRRAILNVIMGLAVIIVLILYLVDIGGPESPFDLEQALTERLAMGQDRSGGIHLALIQRGLEISFSSIENLLVGIGFGSSHMVLDDFFPNNKYANFHCGYLSILVESGLLSLLVFIFIYLYPAVMRREYLPLILALAVFNLFYQLTLDPFFWFSILLLWNNLGDRTSFRSPP